ncbi:MAG TPA: PAS domain S-box protein [Xanthobacteraceae bacterium]
MNDANALLEALPVAVYTTDGEGLITFYNQAAAELWGQPPELGTRWCGSWRLFWPDGRPMARDECPLAVTLKQGRPVRGAEAILEKPDGTRIRFLPYPTLLHDGTGRLSGAINLLLDITTRYEAEMESAKLAAIVTSSDDAIISKTLEGRVTSWNSGASRIFGYEADEMIGQSITRIIPSDLWGDEKDILARLQRGERIDHFETVRLAKDGRHVDISLTVSPLRDKSGRITGASKVARDITERKQAEKFQRLLMAELNHRVKNTLATIRAIASQSLLRARSSGDFATSFNGRIQALAQAHDVLTRRDLQGAELGELVREQVLLGGSDDGRISYSGPLVMLDAQAAVHLSLVIHELGTNARKYGALSVPGGRLSVTWEVHTNGGRNLVLEWRERGGPKVSAPKESGFGTILIEQTLRAHGGEASMRFGADGVTGHICLPLPDHGRREIAMHMAAPQAEPDHATSRDRDDQARLKGKRIVVVEDEPLVSMEMESCLEAAGCQVVGTAGRLENAKSLIANADFDAALIDANLAGEPVDQLAAALTRKNVPFAFVTGYGRDALPHGFGETIIVSKPFTQAGLLLVVERLLYPGAGVDRVWRTTL